MFAAPLWIGVGDRVAGDKLSLDDLKVTVESLDKLPPERGAVMQRHRRSFHEPGHAHERTFSCYRRFQFLRAERPRGLNGYLGRHPWASFGVGVGVAGGTATAIGTIGYYAYNLAGETVGLGKDVIILIIQEVENE